MFRFYAAAAAVFAVCALATPASAQRFIQTPTTEDFAREYPPEAYAAELSGTVEIRCRVQPTGNLAGCQVASETPAGHGFGEAGLRMAQYFRVREVAGGTDGGGRTRSAPRITIPLNFQVTSASDPSAPAANATPGPNPQPAQQPRDARETGRDTYTSGGDGM